MIVINYFSDFKAQSQNKKMFPQNYSRGFKSLYFLRLHYQNKFTKL